jgi:hypothetical protein
MMAQKNMMEIQANDTLPGKRSARTGSSTTQRYAHLDIDPLRRASENIGSRLATAMGDLITNQSSAEEMR